jgi:hypothetical protein
MFNIVRILARPYHRNYGDVKTWLYRKREEERDMLEKKMCFEK